MDNTLLRYDLLIVGGGINGVGIARDAAGRGLSVLLVEQDELAAHTSSASTKLIHGGLRYLEQYAFGPASATRRTARSRARPRFCPQSRGAGRVLTAARRPGAGFLLSLIHISEPTRPY